VVIRPDKVIFSTHKICLIEPRIVKYRYS